MDKRYDVIEIAQKLIACPSVTPQDAGAQVYLNGLLSGLGFECHDLPFEDVPNLFARVGKEGPHLCYAGHTDVVPPGPLEAWTYGPFNPVIEDNVLYGRGASDMKGSVAAFIAAVHQFLTSHGPMKTGSISLLITGDEEGPAKNGTVKVLDWMLTHGHKPDVAIVGEPTNPECLGQEIKIGRRGSLSCHLTIHGKQGHVAYPHLADNPIPKLARAMAMLADYRFDEGSKFFPPTSLSFTSIHAPDNGSNVIPPSASARFNLRFSDVWTCASLEEKIRALLDQLPISYDMTCRPAAESFMTQPGEWADIVVQAVRDVTGMVPALTTGGGTSDARFIAPYVPVVECGAVNETIHQVNECARVDDLARLTSIYVRILERYFGMAA